MDQSLNFQEASDHVTVVPAPGCAGDVGTDVNGGPAGVNLVLVGEHRRDPIHAGMAHHQLHRVEGEKGHQHLQPA